MGYYTYYKLTMSPQLEIDSPNPLMFEELDDDPVRCWLHDGVDGERTWYDYHKDMIALSTKYPAYLFTLTGEGEENEDIWRCFYKGGKSYCWLLEYEFPEFTKEIEEAMI